MTQEEIKRMLRLALIADWDDTISVTRRAAIVTFCARDTYEHIPLSSMQNILPRLCETKRMLQRDLEALWRMPNTLDIDDLVRLLVNEVVNVQIDRMKLTDIDDYDSDD